MCQLWNPLELQNELCSKSNQFSVIFSVQGVFLTYLIIMYFCKTAGYDGLVDAFSVFETQELLQKPTSEPRRIRLQGIPLEVPEAGQSPINTRVLGPLVERREFVFRQNTRDQDFHQPRRWVPPFHGGRGAAPVGSDPVQASFDIRHARDGPVLEGENYCGPYVVPEWQILLWENGEGLEEGLLVVRAARDRKVQYGGCHGQFPEIRHLWSRTHSGKVDVRV